MSLGTYILIILAVFSASFASASPDSFTYQGRIIRSDGTPLEHNNVSFAFEITNPAGNCVFYREQKDSVNMQGSKGVFDVPIGSGTRLFPTGAGADIRDAFKNSIALPCAGGGTHTAAENETRLLKVQFYDGTGWKAITPNNEIRSVPFATFSYSAGRLGNNVPADFVLKTALTTCSVGQYLTFDGTTFSCATDAGGAGMVSDVNVTAPLTKGGTVSVPVLGISVGSAAGTVAAGNDSRFGNATKIQNVAVDATAPTTGQVLKYDGSTAYIPASLAIADITGLSTQLSNKLNASMFPTSCTAGQSLVFVTPSNTFDCYNISITESQISGTIAGSKISGNISGNAAGFTGSLAGDVSGTQGATTVNKIKGVTVDATTPTTGQVLKFNGTNWAPAADSVNAGTVTSVTATSPLSSSGGATPAISLAGLTGLGTANQILGMNNGATAYEYKSISGTTNQVNVAHGAGTVTFSTPQNIHSGASPTFTGLTLSGMNSAGIVKNNASGVLSGGNQISLTADATGVLPVANGGTGASSFANYSVIASNNSGNLTAVSGSTAGTVLQHSATGPVWSTATFPATTTANQLLYSSANNVVGGLATANSSMLVTNGAGVPSWSAISGDTFTQYALLAGRSGGQTLNGGTAASNNLTLDSTSNSTKGNIIIAPTGGYIGVGNTSPQVPLHITSSVSSSAVWPYRGGILVEGEGTSVSGRVNAVTYSDTELPTLSLLRSRGTKAAPTAILSGELIGQITAMGYLGSAFQTGGRTAINFHAAENLSATAQGSRIAFATTASGTTNTFERMSIGDDGFVGIGTSAPVTLLEVSDSTGVTSRGITSTTYSTNPAGLVQTRGARGTPASPAALNSGDVFGWFVFAGHDGTAFSAQSYPTGISALATQAWTSTAHGSGIRFLTTPNNTVSAVEAMRIGADGKVGIGTAATNGNLEVSSSVAGYTMIYNTNTSAGGQAWRWLSSSTAAPLGANSMCFALGVCYFSLYSSGNATLAGTLTQSSDIRLKKDIQPILNALDAITKIQPVTYYWKDKEKDQKKQIGLIAQDVEKVFPEAVNTDNQGYKSVAYQNLVAPIIEAIKELQQQFKGESKEVRAQLQKQERDIASLKEENQMLKKALCKKDKDFCK
ncbi:tail fiber domain-containing protein [Bdellovibrio reynosensis]|uniref:Tail fiber domain-containing protein n=1 Tax=Bdellovibrio reynosensis TaxID=2835041 RepID=A0ABY4C8U0_9BACT|nr:tail fiber domain-containing protein [Bdellovibrio reynosensis]UOF01149.1 tail fiber domain-containing protein [Bdellovibrio reynosensis]